MRQFHLQTFWHSSAHVLGQALELEYGADLTIGPALEEGFYYDCYLGDKTLNDAEKARLTSRMQQVRLCPEGSRSMRDA
jgi:threonyl-tRNA synthetase